jgi:tRNA1Val (adenine37-N6)-methyltransferase
MLLLLLHQQHAQLGTMSNDYFQFKQMRIEQDQCAMKVSTDACIQGAWTPIEEAVYNVLDIGTGTGLLALMLAQRKNTLSIDALEIDHSAAQQALKNVTHAPFKSQINIHETNAQSWVSGHTYDLIICNPPFFSNNLKGVNEQRNLARHNDNLTFDNLAKIISDSLKSNGYASILIPTTERANWESVAQKYELYTVKQLMVKPFEHSTPNRIILILSKKKLVLEEEQLIIYQSPKVYTERFTDLLRPFYLYL